MKKTIALCLAAMMLLCFAACGQEQPNDVPQITMGAQQNDPTSENNTQDAQGATQAQEAGNPYTFTFSDVELIPGAAFDAAKLPDAASTYQVPSCALEGTDNVYNYEAFEVTAFNDGKSEYIYSIYFLDPNLATPEGLALGDTLDKVVDLYGDGYIQEGTSYTYESAGTMLIIILQNDTIASIEYRMVTQ